MSAGDLSSVVTSDEASDQELLCAAAIAGLPDMTPVRLGRLLGGESASRVYQRLRRTPSFAVDTLLGSRARPQAGEGADIPKPIGSRGQKARQDAEELAAEWRRRLVGTSLQSLEDELRAAGVSVLRRGTAGYPARLERSFLPPEVLFVQGSRGVIEGTTAAIVGTRRATRYGLGVAQELAAALAARGVSIVSGLAAGIDGAAHSAALAKQQSGSGPVGVVGGGLDQVYPERNRILWRRVAEAGTLISEAPLGAVPMSWRFPLRNRIIAALSDVVVIVESSRQGGSMHTAQAADAIGVPLLAVPGPIRCEQSTGTNALIAEGGACLVQDVTDVLVALERVRAGSGRGALFGIDGGGQRDSASAPNNRGGQTPAIEDKLLRAVYDYLGESAVLTGEICEHFGMELGQALISLDRLDEMGLIHQAGAAWCRR